MSAALAELAAAFKYAFSGLARAWTTERNFRIESYIGMGVLALGITLRVDLVPLLLVSATVLGFELMNSALEAALDRLAPEPHPLVKQAKDFGAAAVLVSALISVAVGLAVLGPPLLERLFR